MTTTTNTANEVQEIKIYARSCKHIGECTTQYTFDRCDRVHKGHTDQITGDVDNSLIVTSWSESAYYRTVLVPAGSELLESGSGEMLLYVPGETAGYTPAELLKSRYSCDHKAVLVQS